MTGHQTSFEEPLARISQHRSAPDARNSRRAKPTPGGPRRRRDGKDRGVGGMGIVMGPAVGFPLVSAVASSAMLSSDRVFVILAAWNSDAELNGREITVTRLLSTDAPGDTAVSLAGRMALDRIDSGALTGDRDGARQVLCPEQPGQGLGQHHGRKQKRSPCDADNIRRSAGIGQGGRGQAECLPHHNLPCDGPGKVTQTLCAATGAGDNRNDQRCRACLPRAPLSLFCWLGPSLCGILTLLPPPCAHRHSWDKNGICRLHRRHEPTVGEPVHLL